MKEKRKEEIKAGSKEGKDEGRKLIFALHVFEL